MATLYVDEQGAEIHRSGARLIIRKDGEEIRSVRLRDLERLTLIGPIDFTTPAMHAVLDAGIETAFLSVDGHYRGRLSPADSKNVLLRQAQFRRADDAAFRLSMAQTILGAKLRNCRYVIMRYTRNHPDESLEQAERELEGACVRLAGAASVGQCMGIEGAASRTYFAALGRMVRREFAFTERTRRPPRDPVNALLSFGYALLTSELVGALEAHGLDPYAGFVHSIQYGRPALALDILEEFRPIVADRIALSLINNGVLNAGHFEPCDKDGTPVADEAPSTAQDLEQPPAPQPSVGGVRMNEEGRRRYLETYHRTMSAEVADRQVEGRTSFRAMLHQQASRMRQAVLDEARYNPYTPR
jgi:CRISPR-associated protein Cas1